MQKEQRTSFLQVNINAQKFNLFTASLNSIINSQQKQIQQNSKQIAQIKFMIDEKITRLKSESEYQIQKINKKWKEQILYKSCMDNDFKDKQQEATQEFINKISLLEQQISKLNESITQSNNLVYCKIDKDVKQSQIESQKKLDNLLEQIKLMDNQIKKSVNINQSFFQSIMQTYNKGSSDDNNNKKNIVLTARKIDLQSKNQQKDITYSNKISIDDQKLKEKKKKRQYKNVEENLKYASISAKIESLQERLLAKENQKLNIVMIPKKRIDSRHGDHQKNISISMGNIQAQKINFQKSISIKLQNIENIIQQKFQLFCHDLNKFDNNMHKLMIQMQNLQKKMQKQKHKINQIALHVKNNDQNKLDQRGIEVIINTFRKQIRNLEQDISQKVNLEEFNKQKKNIYGKLISTSQLLFKKAEKQQIKKAFQFIQHKIKEIVTLIAEEIQTEKQGAVKKIPFKCLSCDKSLQSTLQNTMRLDKQKKISSRCPTSKIRRRVKLTNDIQKYLD